MAIVLSAATGEVQSAGKKPPPCSDISGKFSPAQRIKDCTDKIQSGRWKGEQLAGFYNNRAAAYMTAFDFDRSIADFGKAIEIDPQRVSYRSNRGTLYAFLRQFDSAIADYNAALKLDPEHASALHGRAAAFAGKKQYDRALADYNAALNSKPRSAQILGARAQTYTAMKDYDRALVDADEAISAADKTKDRLLNNRCWTRAAANRDLDKALADCNRSLELAPNSSFTLNSRGLVQLRRGDLQASLSDYEASIKFAGGDPFGRAHSLYGRGVVKARMGDQAGGEADKAAAIALEPDIADEYVLHDIR